jgi:hypothetical protein
MFDYGTAAGMAKMELGGRIRAISQRAHMDMGLLKLEPMVECL